MAGGEHLRRRGPVVCGGGDTWGKRRGCGHEENEDLTLSAMEWLAALGVAEDGGNRRRRPSATSATVRVSSRESTGEGNTGGLGFG
jgi:hypothetical protein